MNRIQCRNLGFNVDKKQLLQDVTADFVGGQVNVILGQNGAGKSTLLKLLAKSLHSSSGSIQWQGQSLQAISLPQLALQRAVVEQQQAMQFDFSVRQLASLGLEIQFGSELLEAYQHSADFDGLLYEILRVCDLTDFAERSVLSLSGGEFKRAHLARALAQIWPVEQVQQESPDFSGKWLLLDEWNAALDMRHQQCFALLLREWCRQGLGVIMVLHDLPLAQQLADRVLLLKDGAVFAEGGAQNVLQQQTLEQGLQMQLQSVTQNGKAYFLPKF
ncbi:hemin import ATP-binding protein HmuV [Thiosulfatimonas sediminis]|uniref:Hemin import ATP-binding protein HmuV n=1 Tax=Thiosulfatimonas sediminis TaxID=2675054 RepID=A0A6F8PST2_9GAMM|nr:ATP-binding cassette domain-containing protein [Thiosulfatimonas sediminis]BBP45146.1 hemin import ATP-binding protein HmuV [Thiosulfatimonas sediminis]